MISSQFYVKISTQRKGGWIAVSREQKRQQFAQAGDKKNNAWLWPVLGGTLLVFALTGYFLFGSSTSNTPVSTKGGTYVVEQKPDYKGKVIRMTDIKHSVENGGIAFSLNDVKKSGIIYFEYDNKASALPMKAGKLPLMAFVAPNGRVVTAASVCEPCNGYTFRVEGNDLVCNSCGTRWDLNTLKGKSGGCMTYPPDELPYKVEGDKVIIDESAAKTWKPRV